LIQVSKQQRSSQPSDGPDGAKPGYLTSLSRQGLRPVGKRSHASLAPEGLIIGHVFFPPLEQRDKIQVQLYRREVDDGRAHWCPEANGNAVHGDFRFVRTGCGNLQDQ